MTVDDWLQLACEDAVRRGLPQIKPLLESLARSTERLRAVDVETRRQPEAGPSS